MGAPRTLLDKIWARHRVLERADGATLLYVDRHFIHDGANPSFQTLAEKGLKLRRPDRTFGTPDHFVSTSTRDVAAIENATFRGEVETMQRSAREAGVTLFALDDPRQGIVAVVPAWVVPGSGPVKAQAEAEGLDRVFRAAGFEWREAGCSMCVGMNGDTVAAGERCASTSNRNFVGRQGKGARTHLVSPAMAAAAAVTGKLTDLRRVLGPWWSRSR